MYVEKLLKLFKKTMHVIEAILYRKNIHYLVIGSNITFNQRSNIITVSTVSLMHGRLESTRSRVRLNQRPDKFNVFKKVWIVSQYHILLLAFVLCFLWFLFKTLFWRNSTVVHVLYFSDWTMSSWNAYISDFIRINTIFLIDIVLIKRCCLRTNLNKKVKNVKKKWNSL